MSQAGSDTGIGSGQSGNAGRELVRWTFLSNHAHVLLCLANEPAIRQRDIATRVGITERSVGIIVADLVGEGYVTKRRVGRRNRYDVNADQRLRHPLEHHRSIGDLLDLLRADDPRRRGGLSAGDGDASPSR